MLIKNHFRATVERFGIEDLEAVSNILGDNEFVMGGPEPTTLDCTLFGFMCMVLYLSMPESAYTRAILQEKKFQNLVGHTERMKERYWPDWESCKYHPKKN